MAGEPRPDKKAFAEVPLDFGRALRACMRCKLIKTSIQVRRAAASHDGTQLTFFLLQFEADGCENCTKLPMKDDKSVVSQCTTANFNG